MNATTKPIRIDKLTPGSLVDIEFLPNSKRTYFEPAVFLGVTGEGDDRRAHFTTFTRQGSENGVIKSFDWSAYRFNGRWSFGTSAEPMRISSLDGFLLVEA